MLKTEYVQVCAEPWEMEEKFIKHGSSLQNSRGAT